MKGLSRGAARRYARALIDVAQAGVAPAVKTTLGQATEVVAGSADLRHALTHPALSAASKKALLRAVFTGAPDVLARLLDLLVDRGRIALLGLVHEEFVALFNARSGIVSARAVSAVPLDVGQKDALAAALRKATGRDVELQEGLEPTLLGGLKVEMEGRVYDGTVSTQLSALKERLRGGAAHP